MPLCCVIRSYYWDYNTEIISALEESTVNDNNIIHDQLEPMPREPCAFNKQKRRCYHDYQFNSAEIAYRYI